MNKARLPKEWEYQVSEAIDSLENLRINIQQDRMMSEGHLSDIAETVVAVGLMLERAATRLAFTGTLTTGE